MTSGGTVDVNETMFGSIFQLTFDAQRVLALVYTSLDGPCGPVLEHDRYLARPLPVDLANCVRVGDDAEYHLVPFLAHGHDVQFLNVVLRQERILENRDRVGNLLRLRFYDYALQGPPEVDVGVLPDTRDELG